MSRYTQKDLNQDLVDAFAAKRVENEEGEGHRRFVTMCIPVVNAGPQTRQNPIRLKNCLSRALESVEEDSPLAKAITEFDLSASEWENLQAYPSIALVFSESETTLVPLPVPWPQTVICGQAPWLRPFAQSLAEASQALLLCLTKESALLWHINAASEQELRNASFPMALEEIVGGQKEPPSLQHHQRGDNTQYHGQAINKDDEGHDLDPFFREVAQAVEETRRDESGLMNLPLYVAGTDRTIARLRSVADLEIAGEVQGSPDSADQDELIETVREQLHEAAMERVQERLSRCQGSDRGTIEIEKLVPAAKNARVQELLVSGKAPVWGNLKSDLSVEIHPDQREDSVDLVDLAVAHAWTTGAEVIASPRAEDEKVKLAGVLRY